MNARGIQHVTAKSDDGRIVLFPVSQHVLSFRSQEAPGQTRVEAPQEHTTPRSTFWQRFTSSTFTVFLLAMTFGGSPLALGATISYFRDDEVSRGNMFAAGILGFNLNPGEVTEEIAAGGSVIIQPKFTPDDGAFPIEYRVTSAVVGEHTPLCSLLIANGTTSPLVYSGPIVELVTEPATTTGHGFLEVSLPLADGISDGAVCTVDIIYRGWHVGAEDNTGYTDEESDRFTFVYRAPVEEIIEDVPLVEETPLPTEEPQEETGALEVPPEPPVEQPAPSSGDTTEATEQPPVVEPVVENFSPSGGSTNEPSGEPVPSGDAPANPVQESENSSEEGVEAQESSQEPTPQPEPLPDPVPEPAPELQPADVLPPQEAPVTE